MEAMRSLCKNSSCSCITTCRDDDGVGELRRGPWTAEEDALLVHYISCNGEGRWNLLAKCSGLKRTGKSCRLRWLNYLRPGVKRGNLSPEEQLLILELYSKWGNRWSKIAQYLPGRTDNEIKNYWRTRVQKQARHLKMECNSAEFQQLIRNIWMPRLLQKAQLGSSNLLPDSSSVASTQAPLYGLSDNHQNRTLYAATAENMGSSPSSMSSSDSANISSMPHEYHQAFEFSENPIFPVSNNNLYDHSRNECCNVDSNNISSDIDILNSTSAAANVTATGGSLGPANFGSGQNNCLSDDMGFCMWNSLDEFWQLREIIGSLNQSQ